MSVSIFMVNRQLKLRWPRSTTFSYKPQLFSTNRNYFLQTTTFFYKSQLFSTFLQLFSTFLQLFSTILQLFSAKPQLFSTEGISESSVWIKEKSVISLVYHMCREDGKWITSAESRSVRGASHQLIFMGNCLTICYMYFPCLLGEWVSFCLPGTIAVSANAAWM